MLSNPNAKPVLIFIKIIGSFQKGKMSCNWLSLFHSPASSARKQITQTFTESLGWQPSDSPSQAELNQGPVEGSVYTSSLCYA